MEKKVNSGAVIGIAAGIAVIILAVVLLISSGNSIDTNRLSASDLSTSSQFQLSYSFGADFYTEMFGVTYNALQQLTDMSKDNASNIAQATNSIVSGISIGLSQVIRMIAFVIMAIGAGIFGLSFSRLYTWVPCGSLQQAGTSDHTSSEKPLNNISNTAEEANAEPSRKPDEEPEESHDDHAESEDKTTGTDEIPSVPEEEAL